jgi:hypothetical protein
MPAARQTDIVVNARDVAGIDVSAVAVDMQGRQIFRFYSGRLWRRRSRSGAIEVIALATTVNNQKSCGLAMKSA